MLKTKPWRSKKYLKWVKTLACVKCHRPADDPHHIIGKGYGGTGTKAPDHMVMPMCRECHSNMHNFSEQWDMQEKWALETIHKALQQGIFNGID